MMSAIGRLADIGGIGGGSRSVRRASHSKHRTCPSGQVSQMWLQGGGLLASAFQSPHLGDDAAEGIAKVRSRCANSSSVH